MCKSEKPYKRHSELVKEFSLKIEKLKEEERNKMLKFGEMLLKILTSKIVDLYEEVDKMKEEEEKSNKKIYDDKILIAFKKVKMDKFFIIIESNEYFKKSLDEAKKESVRKMEEIERYRDTVLKDIDREKEEKEEEEEEEEEKWVSF